MNKDAPAFPHFRMLRDGVTIDLTVGGLTKREYFAAMMLQGILSKPTIFVCEPTTKTASFDLLRKTAAEDAVANADALIKELSRGDEE